MRYQSGKIAYWVPFVSGLGERGNLLRNGQCLVGQGLLYTYCKYMKIQLKRTYTLPSPGPQCKEQISEGDTGVGDDGEDDS